MEHTAEHPPPRRGLIRRLVGARQARGGDGVRSDDHSPPDLIDLADAPPEFLLQRIERLEEGARLLAETMKQSHGRLTAALEDLRRQTARAASLEEVRRVVADTLARLQRRRGEPIIPIVPFEARGPQEQERVDALTALRRGRFSESEMDGSPGGVEGAP